MAELLLKGSFRELSSSSPGFRDFYGLNWRRLLSYISTCDARKSVFFFSRNTVHDKYIIKFKFYQLNSGLFSFLFATLLNWAARIHRTKIFTSQLFFFSQADLIMNRAIIVLFVATFACFYFIVSKRLIIRDIYIYM